MNLPICVAVMSRFSQRHEVALPAYPNTMMGGEAAEGLEAALSEPLSDLVPPGMTHELSVAGEEEAVAVEVREQLFLVLREAVRKAVSHSGAGRVSVAIEVDEERIVGVVEDEGRGCEPVTVEGGGSGGLTYMAERASLVSGDFSVYTAPGGGARAEASFPLWGAVRPAR